MSRSFGFVDEKVREADYFLEGLKVAGPDLEEARYIFNAFASSARSITFSLQAVMKPIPGFSDWYQTKQSELKKDALAQFFVTMRNESQKIGSTPLNRGTMRSTDEGKLDIKFWFRSTNPSIPLSNAPDSDVVTACRNYLIILVKVVYDCYREFGNVIDPRKFYSLEEISKRGQTVKDLERHLGFPEGWTRVSKVSDEQRIKKLTERIPDANIDAMFLKYLGCSRP